MPLNALLPLNDGAIFAGFRIMRLLGSGASRHDAIRRRHLRRHCHEPDH